MRVPALALCALALAACTPERPAPVASASGVPAAQAATAERFVGRWTGIWNADSSLPTTLIIQRIDAGGTAIGTYQFRQDPPVPIRATVEGNTLSWGGAAIAFTFALRDDGQLHGQRAASGNVATTVLRRS